jgi:hypothetical protein
MSITKTIELDKFCKSILSVDRNVRSVAVLDKKGSALQHISSKIYATKFREME